MLLTYTKAVNNVIGIFFLNPKIDFGFKEDFTLRTNLLHKILNLRAGFCFLYRVDR